ncbi:MAG: hypothetical protein SGPRY_001686 [Prymnesium sp.]
MDSQKQAAQLQLKSVIEAVVISPTASSSDVDVALDTIESVWPKIKAYDHQSSAQPAIEFALSRFPQSYTRMHHIAALQAVMDVQSGCPWQTFAEFRSKLVETLAMAEARTPAEAIMVVSDHKQKKELKSQSQCKICDLRSCSATRIKRCYVCSDLDDVPLPGASPYQRRLAKIYSTYKREHQLADMKGRRYLRSGFSLRRRDLGKRLMVPLDLSARNLRGGRLTMDLLVCSNHLCPSSRSAMMSTISGNIYINFKLLLWFLRMFLQSPMATRLWWIPLVYHNLTHRLPRSTQQCARDESSGAVHANVSPAYTPLSAEESLKQTMLLQSERRNMNEQQARDQHARQLRDMEALHEKSRIRDAQSYRELQLRESFAQQSLQHAQGVVDKQRAEMNSLRDALFDVHLRACTLDGKIELVQRELSVAISTLSSRSEVGAKASRQLTVGTEKMRMVADLLKLKSANNNTWFRVILAAALSSLVKMHSPAMFDKAVKVVLGFLRVGVLRVSGLVLRKFASFFLRLCSDGDLVRLQSRLGEVVIPEMRASIVSSGQVALMGSLHPSMKQAVMYDTGCTTLMTNNTRGIIGDIESTAAVSFKTAAGTHKFSKVGVFQRTICGSNGVSLGFQARWFYNPDLPWDIVGPKPLRDDLVCSMWTVMRLRRTPRLSCMHLRKLGVVLTLARTSNGLEWLSYAVPKKNYAVARALPLWTSCEKAALAAVGAGDEVALPLDSSGAGMGRLSVSLTPLQKATLDHVRRGHTSLERAIRSSRHTVGGLTLDTKAMAEVAVKGCDVCNAYKLKLVNPREKNSYPQTTSEARQLVLYYDSFGKVSVPSAQHGYHYAHMFMLPAFNVAWLRGSRMLDDVTVAAIVSSATTAIRLWINKDIEILRMDSFSTNKSSHLLAILEKALLHPQWSPPGQHAYLGDLERMWYPVLVRALICMRHGRAPASQWYNAMAHALDVECTLTSAKDTQTPYTKALGIPTDISDMRAFYAPGRFALDKSALPNKWVERARAGFWVGRDIEFVMAGKQGSAIWWDGHIHRTVVNNFFVQESVFLDLQAPVGPPAREVVYNARDKSTMITGIDEPSQVPLSLQRARRETPIVHYGNVCAIICDDSEANGECSTCNYGWYNARCAMPVVQPELLSPAANIVINLFSGPYNNPNGISACLRSKGVGVLDVDSSPEYGGGRIADLTCNATFNFLVTLIKSGRVNGILAAQPCGSGSVIRLRTSNGDEPGPPPVRSTKFPDRIPHPTPSQAKDIHKAELLSYRTNYLCQLVYEKGGWFFAECPAVRGDDAIAASYDPAFKGHASVQSSPVWKKEFSNTGAVTIVVAM